VSRRFEELFKKYGPMVVRRCRAILRDEDIAMDVSQEVFLKVLKKGDLEKLEYPSSYLYTVATNLSLNYLRDNKKQAVTMTEQTLMFLESPDSPENQVINSQFLDYLFSQVKASTKTIAYLHYVDGFTLEETAEMVGMSMSGIRKRLRALKAMGLKVKGDD